MTRRLEPQPAPPRTAWTVPEVAASLGLSARHVYRMAEQGEIPSFRAGRRVLVPARALTEFVERAAAAS